MAIVVGIHELLSAEADSDDRLPERERRLVSMRDDFASDLPDGPRPGPGSRMRLWICSCEKPVKVRVARDDFRAHCDVCGAAFIRGEPDPRPRSRGRVRSARVGR